MKIQKLKKIFDWFKTKTSCAIFAVIAFVGGFLFLNLSLTGNVIVEKDYYVSIVPLIGILLIICSFILVIYIVRNK